MNIELRIVLIIITLIYIVFLIKSTKNKKIQISFSTFWLTSSFILLFAIAFPGLIEWIAHNLGFEATSNMIFLITIFVAFCLIFGLTIKMSQEHKKNVLLIQELSLLKDRVSKLEDNKKTKESKNE